MRDGGSIKLQERRVTGWTEVGSFRRRLSISSGTLIGGESMKIEICPSAACVISRQHGETSLYHVELVIKGLRFLHAVVISTHEPMDKFRFLIRLRTNKAFRY